MSAQTLLGLVCGQRQGAWPLCAAPPPCSPPTPTPSRGCQHPPSPDCEAAVAPAMGCVLPPSILPSLPPSPGHSLQLSFAVQLC